jgi:large-conductance mechanosensitive channel
LEKFWDKLFKFLRQVFIQNVSVKETKITYKLPITVCCYNSFVQKDMTFVVFHLVFLIVVRDNNGY